jgi:hypothetical protein
MLPSKGVTSMRVRGVWLLFLVLGLAGCPRRDQPPASAYDPELLEAAQNAARRHEATGSARDDPAVAPARAECDRLTGGCPEGFLCWDSWYCKLGTDQCSSSGDKRCHKLCSRNADCPEDMPVCVARAVFRGTAEGTEERFCVAEEP